VALTLDDGSCVEHSLDDVVAATPELVRERFRSAAAAVVGAGRASVIEAFVDDLVNEPDAGRLAVLTATEKTA
jgi:hypothetical protein